LKAGNVVGHSGGALIHSAPVSKGVPLRTAIGLIACYVVGAVLAGLLGTGSLIAMATSGSRPPDLPGRLAGFFLFSYAVGTAIGSLTMILASRRALGLFVVGAASACVAASAAGSHLGSRLRDLSDPVYPSVVPIVVSLVVTITAAYWRQLFSGSAEAAAGLVSTGGEVATGLAMRAVTGRTQLAIWSLAVFATGYIPVVLTPSLETLVMGAMASALSVYLALRSLPNAIAIIALVSATLFLIRVLSLVPIVR
jgi:hypothetical protein